MFYITNHCAEKDVLVRGFDVALVVSSARSIT